MIGRRHRRCETFLAKRIFHMWVAKGRGVPVLLLRSNLSLTACRASLPW